jgi:hypothetical protein
MAAAAKPSSARMARSVSLAPTNAEQSEPLDKLDLSHGRVYRAASVIQLFD